MGVELAPRPVQVKQALGPKCWAAAFTSWLTVNKNRPQLNQQQLIERYGNPEKEGSISFKDDKWLELVEDMRLTNSYVVTPKKFEDKPPAERDNALRAQEREYKKGVEHYLKEHGYLLLVFNHTRSRVRGFISHMVVVFGTKTKDNRLTLTVMDPTQGAFAASASRSSWATPPSSSTPANACPSIENRCQKSRSFQTKG
jgi:hypothetical protein